MQSFLAHFDTRYNSHHGGVTIAFLMRSIEHSSWNFAENFCKLRGILRGKFRGLRGELRGNCAGFAENCAGNFAKIQLNTV